MRKVASKYMLGLSATPKRKDGLQWVFESFIGPIVYMTKDIVTEGVEVNVIDYYSEDLNYCKECLNYMGKPVLPKMINNICGYQQY